MTVFVRNPYNYDTDQASLESAYVDETGEVLVQQAPTEDCDINTIVRRFGVTGQMEQVIAPPSYGDFDQVVDFHSAMLLIRQAQEAFMAQPADVRTRFRNDPGAFADFCSDPKNVDELLKLGLAVARPSASVAAPAAGAGAPQAAPAASPGDAPKAS